MVLDENVLDTFVIFESKWLAMLRRKRYEAECFSARAKTELFIYCSVLVVVWLFQCSPFNVQMFCT